MRVEAAISPCPNDVFIFAGLILGRVDTADLDFDFGFHDLESLNQGALACRWDLTKISYAAFPACAGDYRLLRCGGALGRGCGPLLLANGAVAKVAGSGAPGAAAPGVGWDPAREVLIPGLHTTANFLLDFYARDTGLSPLRKVPMAFDALYRRLLQPSPCQGVVIHEMRFTYAADGLNLVRDLGEHWEKTTGHPIPLGAVAVKHSREREFPGFTALSEGLIQASLDWSHAHRAEALALCRRHSQSMSDAVLLAHIDLYVNEFTRELGGEGQAAVDYFLEYQHRLNALPE